MCGSVEADSEPGFTHETLPEGSSRASSRELAASELRSGRDTLLGSVHEAHAPRTTRTQYVNPRYARQGSAVALARSVVSTQPLAVSPGAYRPVVNASVAEFSTS
jgi:hypothetical protein